uniref:Protein kinase domain-containing protein n=1 Tax=Oryza brachyantha TaxID=4533 RepID=J3MW83_ORYBR
MAVIHRDVKSDNILLDNCMIAKVSNNGASRGLSTNQNGVTTEVQGTFGYMDLEYYQISKLTDKSDTYNFGSILLELLIGQKPVKIISDFTCFVNQGRVLEILDPLVHAEGGKDAKAVTELAATCLNWKRQERPSMRQVEIKLRELLREDHNNYTGAIDGTHVPITINPKIAAPYRNRKSALSQNVMLACDFDLDITFISCGWEGSATDARVLRSAQLSGFRVPEGKFYLVDGGYANTPSFLAPYHGVRYDLKEFGHGHRRPTNYKELFNQSYALLRNHIERAIGVLKKRFPILKVGTFHPIENQMRIPTAAAVFHNLIRGYNGDERWLDHQPHDPHNISPENFVDVPDGDSEYNNDVSALNNQTQQGNVIRDAIAMAMWNDYVMWENCRTQNGWTPEGWKRIVPGFHDKFPHVTFSKRQIQDKEKELKRDYMCLKDARSQSGVSWDDKLGMIVADDPTVWSNICFSFPPAKKFCNKPFPIFEALGELHDGQTAEGLLSFTSLQPTNTQDQTTNPQDDVVTEIGADEFDN